MWANIRKLRETRGRAWRKHRARQRRLHTLQRTVVVTLERQRTARVNVVDVSQAVSGVFGKNRISLPVARSFRTLRVRDIDIAGWLVSEWILVVSSPTAIPPIDGPENWAKRVSRNNASDPAIDVVTPLGGMPPARSGGISIAGPEVTDGSGVSANRREPCQISRKSSLGGIV